MSDSYHEDTIEHIVRKGKNREMDRYGISIQKIDDHGRVLLKVRRATDWVVKEFSDWNSKSLGRPTESDTPVQAAVLGFVRVIEDAIVNIDDKEKFLSQMKEDIPEVSQERYIMGDDRTPSIIRILQRYDTEKIKWGSFSLGTAQYVGEESDNPSDHDQITIEVSFRPTTEDSPTFYHLNIRKTDHDDETADRSRKQHKESEPPSVSSEDQNDEFLRPFARIYNAWSSENKRYQENPLQPDLFAESMAVAAWSIVTCCYSGIEQAMKCLLKMQGSYDSRTKWQGGHEHHFIGSLFKNLTTDEQDVIRDSYAIYRSLHEYISPETADDFLDVIDSGYVKWRYFLLDGNDQNKWPPKTHAGAMLEIWFTLCQIMRTKRGSNLEITTVNQDIERHLWDSLFRNAYFECLPFLECYMRDGEGIGSAELSELYSWVNSYESRIDAFSALIYAHAKGNVEYAYKDFRPTTRVIFSTFLNNVEEDHSYRREEVKHFIRRAKETRIRWNQEEKKFVS